jgi:hypothetical protein
MRLRDYIFDGILICLLFIMAWALMVIGYGISGGAL